MKIPSLWLLTLTTLYAFFIFIFPGWLDAPELSAGIHTLGVTHPPGQPVYILFGKLLTWMPIASVAFRTSFFSLACVALSAYLLSYCYKENIWKSLFIITLVFLTPEIALQGARTEVYATCFLFTVCVLLLCFKAQATEDVRYTFSASLVFGLFLATHPVVALCAAPYFLATYRTLFKKIYFNLGFMILGLSSYLFVPLRALAHPPLNWGEPTTFHALMTHLLAMDYRAFDVPSLTFFALALHLLKIFNIFWITSLCGAYGMFKTRNYLKLTVMILIIAINLIFAVKVGFYPQNADAYGYLIPTVLCLIYLTSFADLPLMRPHPKKIVFGIFFTFFFIFKGIQSYAALNVDGAKTSYYLSQSLVRAPTLSVHEVHSDHWFFPTLYRHLIEHQRPDTVLISKGLLPAAWYRGQVSEKIKPFTRRPSISETGEKNTEWIAKEVLPIWSLIDETCFKRTGQDNWKTHEGLCTQTALNVFYYFLDQKRYDDALYFLENVLQLTPKKSSSTCAAPKALSLPFNLDSRTVRVFLPSLVHLRNEYLLLSYACGREVDVAETDDINLKIWMRRLNQNKL